MTTPWNIPNMNHRAFDLLNMTANDDGVKEPEASGAIAWILYNAYKKTGNKEYRISAEQCIEFLNNQTSILLMNSSSHTVFILQPG